jgi:hypothetical protein
MRRHPFNDHFHDKAEDANHIRLISEGGGSFAKSPCPVCIDSIQVAHSCTTESLHMVYRSSTGACSMFCAAPAVSLFSVSSDCVRELEQGCIPDALRIGFQQRGIALSDQAGSETVQNGRNWLINDRGARYSIKKIEAELQVYREPEILA